MAEQSTLSMLEEVQAAITATLNMQSYSIGDRRVQRARLEALTAREEVLIRRYRRETSRNFPRVSYAKMEAE